MAYTFVPLHPALAGRFVPTAPRARSRLGRRFLAWWHRLFHQRIRPDPERPLVMRLRT